MKIRFIIALIVSLVIVGFLVYRILKANESKYVSTRKIRAYTFGISCSKPRQRDRKKAGRRHKMTRTNIENTPDEDTKLPERRLKITRTKTLNDPDEV